MRGDKDMRGQLFFNGKIISVKSEPNMKEVMLNKKSVKGGAEIINFYWEWGDEKIWLFSQKYTLGVHEMFKNGVRDYDIRKFNKWRRNPRLDKTIEKIPMYMSYALKEVI